ncbi:MAG TPA: hypothetical protein VD768_08725 [Sphingomicrobium sp.]|nr:hypothetical protein [Sphingomicrobium sp.]
METIRGATIEGERILIGHAHYVECTFVRCSFVFDGTADKNVGCRYVSCGFTLEGAAVETLRFLRGMWEGGAFNLVQELAVAACGRGLSFDK